MTETEEDKTSRWTPLYVIPLFLIVVAFLAVGGAIGGQIKDESGRYRTGFGALIGFVVGVIVATVVHLTNVLL